MNRHFFRMMITTTKIIHVFDIICHKTQTGNMYPVFA